MYNSCSVWWEKSQLKICHIQTGYHALTMRLTSNFGAVFDTGYFGIDRLTINNKVELCLVPFGFRRTLIGQQLMYEQMYDLQNLREFTTWTNNMLMHTNQVQWIYYNI